MIAGDRVTVYEDPITEKKVEGRAEILEIIGEPIDNIQLCQVRFANDGFETTRQVKIKTFNGV